LRRYLQLIVIAIAGLAGFGQTAGAALTVDEMLAIGTLGSDKAPVTIVEYASLTCPHCAAFANDTFDAFKKKYIDTGKVRYTFRDFPFDQPGLRAAMMSRCAGPDRFFGFIQILFKSQKEWAGSKDPMGELAKIARLGGESKEDFDACMANKALMDGILKVEYDAQQNLKVDSTPTFIVNGARYAGNMSLEQFDKILEPLLSTPGTSGAAAPPGATQTAAVAGSATPATPIAAPPNTEPGYLQRLWLRVKSMF
jgi:protein-disulfide isomerase